VEKFIDHTIFDEGKPLVVLAGKLDRLIVRERDLGCLVVRDYKTARPQMNIQEACLQLALARLHWPEFTRLELELDWIDEGGRVDRDVITTSSVRGIYPKVLARVKEIISSNDHVPERNEGCGFCPLRESCDPEAGVEVDIEADIF
jgi:CRISPR/Cas system-associated exonuclease Cas4 (RecB family)